MAKKRGPAPKTEGKRVTTISFKCTEEFRDWLLRYAESSRDTASHVIDLALAQKAKADGFEPPPKR